MKKANYVAAGSVEFARRFIMLNIYAKKRQRKEINQSPDFVLCCRGICIYMLAMQRYRKQPSRCALYPSLCRLIIDAPNKMNKKIKKVKRKSRLTKESGGYRRFHDNSWLPLRLLGAVALAATSSSRSSYSMGSSS